MEKKNLLQRMKNRVPVLFGMLTAVLYLVILNVSVLGIVYIVGERTACDPYLLQFLGTAAGGIVLLLIALSIGYGKIFREKGRGILYSIGTGGYLLTVDGIAFASNLGMYLLTEQHELRPAQPALAIFIFILSMFGIGFAEELVFRGIFMNLLREKISTGTDRGIFLVLIIQGVFFGLCHMVNALGGARLEGVIVQAIMASLLGIMFGAIYLRTNSFWFLACLHAFNDFCALLPSGIYGIDNLTDTISGYSWINLAGAPLYLLVIGILLRRRKREEIKSGQIMELSVPLKVVKGILLTGTSLFFILLVFVSTLYVTWMGL